MTASEFARFTNAKKVGKGKWITLCPSHPDRHPSLSITEGRKVPVLLKCQSHNCDPKDILKAFGLTWQAVFEGKASPAIRRRVSLRDAKDALERQLGLVIMLQVLERPRYWRAAERRIRGELFWVRWELEPDRVEEEVLKWQLHRKKHSTLS